MLARGHEISPDTCSQKVSEWFSNPYEIGRYFYRLPMGRTIFVFKFGTKTPTHYIPVFVGQKIHKYSPCPSLRRGRFSS